MQAKAGRLDLGTKTGAKARFTVVSNAARDDVVLRIGTGCGYTLICNGEEVAQETGARQPLRDRDSVLIELKKGENVFDLSLAADGVTVLFVQVTDPRGLAERGVRSR